MTMSTTVHDRYQIDDSCCGQVETATSLNKAIAIAKAHAFRHSTQADNTITEVTVFDRMARRDCTHTWSIVLPQHSQVVEPEQTREAKQ